MKVKTLLPLLLAAMCFNISVRAQIIGSRLISQTNNLYALSIFTPTDSTTYAYSGLHTSDMTTGIYQYDSSVYYLYDTAYHMQLKTYQSFDMNDSVFLYNIFQWNDTTNNWEIYDTRNKTFGANHLDSVMTEFIAVGGVPQPAYQYVYHYNASNNIILQERNKWNGALYDSDAKYVYTYDSHNYLTVVTTSIWNLTFAMYVNNEEKDYMYDTTTGLTSIYTHKYWNTMTNAWEINDFTFYRYDASKKLTAAYYNTFNATMSGVFPSAKDTFIYDASGKLINVINSTFDMPSGIYTNNKRSSWTYNTWNQPLVFMTESWDGSSWSLVNGQDHQTRNHYEEYPNDVKNVTKKGGSLQVYPIPAQNYLNISLVWNTSQPFTVSIYDIQGRLIQQLNEGSTKNYNKTIPLAGVPSGNYVLVIKGAEQQLVRQIVVNK